MKKFSRYPTSFGSLKLTKSGYLVNCWGYDIPLLEIKT